ncbi:MAG: hypothetical protein WB950_15420, partial [Acidobacteriaceae bacterium]
ASIQPCQQKSSSGELQDSYHNGNPAEENSSDVDLKEQIADPNVVELEVRDDLVPADSVGQTMTAAVTQSLLRLALAEAAVLDSVVLRSTGCSGRVCEALCRRSMQVSSGN